MRLYFLSAPSLMAISSCAILLTATTFELPHLNTKLRSSHPARKARSILDDGGNRSPNKNVRAPSHLYARSGRNYSALINLRDPGQLANIGHRNVFLGLTIADRYLL